MKNIIQCNECQSKLKVNKRLSKGKCPRCGNQFKLPSSEPSISDDSEADDQSLHSTAILNGCYSDTAIDFILSSPEINKANHDSQRTLPPVLPSASKRNKKTRQSVINLILHQLKKGFPKESSNISYRMKLSAVGLAMFTVPVIYLGIIAGIGYSLFQYAVNSFSSSFESFGLSSLLYSGILLYTGLILILFIKPFLGCYHQTKRKRRLERSEAPDLYLFVDHLCEMIHCPKPKIIVIDMEGNASAAFRSKSLLRQDELILTIGLPLVANLTISQFAGILAHEFGHFSQRWGMFLTQLIRTVHLWLKKSVKQPDLIDDFIKTNLYSGNLFLIAVAVFLWFPDKIVHLFLKSLLFISKIFSSFLLREMEYEADRYQGRLVGVDQMTETMQRVLEINYALILARYSIVNNSSSENVTENFPEYVSEIRNLLTEEIHDEINVHMTESQTAFLGTHPSLKDRILAQDSFKWPGFLNTKVSAKILFRNFEKLSISQTKKVFKHLIR